uniref:beta-lactamase n=1 Tax=Desulfurella acetivorans TaxID=33002 RepID=A0A832AUJ3_DESAE
MKKYFLSLVLLLMLFGFVNASYANEIEKCFHYLKLQKYQLALESGQNAVKSNPENTEAHVCLGEAYTNLGYFGLSIKEFQIAEKLTSDKGSLAIIYSYLGIDHDNLGDSNTALLNYNKELQIAKELNDIEEESLALNNIANIYLEQGNYDKSLEYLNKSLQLTSKPTTIATIYNNIATIYLYKNDNNKAVEYYKKALEFNQEAGNYRGAAHVMLNLGTAYTNLQDFSEAERYLRQGLEMVQKISDKYWEAVAYESLGQIYLAQNKKALASEYFTRAYNLYRTIGDNNDAKSVYEKYLK